MEKVEDLIKELHELEKRIIVLYEHDVDYIIENNVTDIDEIEKVLDNILCIDTVETTHLYFKLYDYYKKINQEYANEYKKIYEMHKMN